MYESVSNRREGSYGGGGRGSYGSKYIWSVQGKPRKRGVCPKTQRGGGHQGASVTSKEKRDFCGDKEQGRGEKRRQADTKKKRGQNKAENRIKKTRYENFS